MSAFPQFMESYRRSARSREEMGIPSLPLTAEQVRSLCRILVSEDLVPAEASDALALLDDRVTPGVTETAMEKSSWLGQVLSGAVVTPYLAPREALIMLGHMGGGANIPPLVEALGSRDEIASLAASLLALTILIPTDRVMEVQNLARQGHPHARETVRLWAEAAWYTSRPAVPGRMRMVVVRTTGEINTDFLSPAQEAGTRDDIPLHALSILSTSPGDRNFISRVRAFREKTGLPVLFAGDVVGTGSSRKSASNSLVWWIGNDIPHFPNKRRGGVVAAAKIAPIFFNTLRGCGVIPVRCPTGNLAEGEVVEVDLAAGTISRGGGGEVLTRFTVNPPSILEEARAGGRNLLIIGRKLTAKAREVASQLTLPAAPSPIAVPGKDTSLASRKFSLAQKLVGNAAGLIGALPGMYVEPRASIVFSQDTTGKMTQQELEELACTSFATVFVQSFCHTPAGPRSKDARMQFELAGFVSRLGGIALRPGDGIIHTVGNRFLLPSFVGTGGDSHTRFPIGISFPAGSDMVAFAASQGYLPLDMPESVLVRFTGEIQPGITTRDLVNAIPWVAAKRGLVNLGKGDEKANVFADRILEIEGLESLTVEDSYRFTDASAERSSAAATFRHDLDQVEAYVRNNLAFLKKVFSARNPSPQVAGVVRLLEEWLASPSLLQADEGAPYAETIEVDLAAVTEPLLAAPNDPDKIVPLSAAAGTPIEEVFIGSCMTDIGDFRTAARVLAGGQVPIPLRFWTVPPDRESAARLGEEGVYRDLLSSGANIHVPGCSLCMGNQAQVASGATVVSTSTRNFENRMGTGAKVYLASSAVAAMAGLLGRIPSLEEYRSLYRKYLLLWEKETGRRLAF